ncbi:hypothetical protein [Hymenobacter cheonanensis]|uniref:hypothetical protein n=1 Tax=Hymenobacter sp. CA2-7 TaxID=3063993 RepID=UPI0027128528|nr:hypothetical protein [Hymenobacter sp. CA2-7]MDO7886931.1 hypothetical protein [Hymenobacter sp. CA2-7]
MKGFKVYQLDATHNPPAASGRRDLYTMYLLTGARRWQCADQAVERDGTYLFIGTPSEAENVASAAIYQAGYGCLFTSEFVQEGSLVGAVPPWAVLTGKYTRTLLLGNEQATYLVGLFEKMLAEQQSAYRFKDELLRSYLNLVLHEATRLCQPAVKYRFRYYCQQPETGSTPRLGWGSRRRQG